MADFITDRNLLNPRFEGYKLSPLPQEEHVLRYPLASKPTQANVSGRTKVPLSFQEVQSRVTHKHLAVCRQSKRAAYVDAGLTVIGIDVDEASQFLFFGGESGWIDEHPCCEVGNIKTYLPSPLRAAKAHSIVRGRVPAAGVPFRCVCGRVVPLRLRRPRLAICSSYQRHRPSRVAGDV